MVRAADGKPTAWLSERRTASRTEGGAVPPTSPCLQPGTITRSRCASKPSRNHNMLADILDVANDVVIPEPQDGPAILFEPRCPRFFTGSIPMLGAVDFDDQLLLRTSKVDDVAGNRKLPSEAKPHQPVSTKFVPELELG